MQVSFNLGKYIFCEFMNSSTYIEKLNVIVLQLLYILQF